MLSHVDYGKWWPNVSTDTAPLTSCCLCPVNVCIRYVVCSKDTNLKKIIYIYKEWPRLRPRAVFILLLSHSRLHDQAQAGLSMP